MNTLYGFTSKAFPFGNPPSGAAPTAIPKKGFATASYGVGVGERLVIKATLGLTTGGAYQYLTLLDATNTAGTVTYATNLLDQEVDFSPVAPVAVANWATVLKIEFYVDPVTTPPYARTEPFQLYVYRNQLTGQNQSFVGNPPSTGAGTGGVSGATAAQMAILQQAGLTQQYLPLAGVQARFYAKGSGQLIDVGTSDMQGRIAMQLPPGSYDIILQGHRFQPNDSLTGTRAVTVGVSDNVSRFGVTAATVSDTEFASIKDRMASLRWVGYIVPEDFTVSRAAFWNPATDPSYAGTDQRLYTNLADIRFGRLFRGNSWVEYIGLGTDPLAN